MRGVAGRAAVAGVVMAGLLAFAPGLASADTVSTTGVSALAPRDLFDAAPALAGDRVLYGVANGNAIGFWTAPLGGGPATHLPELTADGPIDGWALAADDERLAVDAYVTNEQGSKGHAVLFSAPIGAVPGVLADPVANLTSVQRQSLFVSGSQVLTLETRAGRLVARDASGGRSEVSLPAGAQSALATVTGPLVAVPVTSSHSTSVVVIDRASGSVLRSVPTNPRFGGPYALAVGPDGALVFVGDGALQWSPAGSDRFVRVAASPEVLTPVIRDNRVAYSDMQSGGPLARPTVIELPPTQPPAGGEVEPRVVFQGPPTEHVRGLDFDGTHLAWATTTCQMLSAVPAPSTRAIPPGPCIRSDVSFTGFGADRPSARRPWLRLGVTCATASDGVCHLTIYAYQGPLLAKARADVPVGPLRKIVHIRLNRRALRRVRRHPDTVVMTARLRDPSGRTYDDPYVA